ncbi:hypothetical protein [Kitasatospora sp. NPDC057936]|uniref:hypothetical protein n=1 Tax=Kitasatospora sp. NPDC057936 TaxID=3346283 RepID=UPI0036DD815C
MSKIQRGGGLVMTVLTAVLALLVGLASPASAALGEGSQWYQETENEVNLQSGDTISEARSPDTLIQVWRGNDNNRVWISRNGGAPVVFPGTQTQAAPRVVWTANGFYVFHTGVDGRIYYTQPRFTQSGILSQSQPANWWSPEGNVVTRPNLSPSVTPVRNGEMLLSWGSATDNNQYTASFDGANWAAPRQVPGVLSDTANSIAYSSYWDQFALVHRGLDGRAYVMTRDRRSDVWGQPQRLDDNLQIFGTPSIAFTTETGDGVIAVLGNSGNGYHQAYLGQWTERSWSGFQHENTYAGMRNNPWLTATARSVFLIATFYQGLVQWKVGFDRRP